MGISQVTTTLNGSPKTLASAITYLPYGGITGLTYGNGLSLTRGYDNQYRISSLITGSIFNLAYGYDPNGNVISIVDANNPTGVETLENPENPETYSYETGTNRLSHIETTPPIDFGYDLNANITSETGWTYVYDFSNQLISVSQGATQVGEYTYNGAGQRIKKVSQTETRIFHYDLRGHLIAETNQSGQMLAEYIYLGDQLLAMIKPGELVYYFHNDHLGTPQVLTDDTGAIVWKAVYTPFGEAAPSIQTVENPFRFPGQYYDQETGLHYNYFRYYNPQTGRYITPDPIGLEGGINLFAYTENNPINFVDPLGLYSWNEFWGDAGNLSSGFADTLSKDILLSLDFYRILNSFVELPSPTQAIRQIVGADDVVDPCSGWYKGGKWGAYAWETAAGGGGSLNAGSRTVLYSGKGALEAAQAVKGSGMILAETIGGKGLNYLERQIVRLGGKGLPQKVWDAASGVFAANAKAEVQIFLRNPSLRGVYNRIERPVLNFFNNTIRRYR
jgi:RHS repeat-associated protein